MPLKEILEELNGNDDLKSKVAAELGWIPETRLKSKSKETRDLKAEVSRLDTELLTAMENNKGTDGLRAQVEQLTEKLQAADSRYSTYSTITGAGFTDPSVIRTIEAEWQSLPADDRPTLPEQIAAWKDGKVEVPGILAPHIKPRDPTDPPADPPADPPPQPPSNPPRPPDPHRGAHPPQPPSGVNYSAQQLMGMTTEQYRAARASMGMPGAPPAATPPPKAEGGK